MSDTRFNQFVAGFDSELAEEYARVRPTYPAAFFDWAAEVAPGTDLAWDAGTGAGELAVGLSERFDKVVASDTNPEMLRQARQRPNLYYHDGPSEAPELDVDSVDLVTSGMAAHWFDTDRFYSSCKKILRPGGVLVALGFYFFDTDDGVGALVRDWYHESMLGFEFPELTVLREGYVNFPFPFAPLTAPAFNMREHWSVQQLAGFLSQWIVNKRARAAGEDHLSPLLAQIHARWNDDSVREIRWPIFLVATRFET